MGEEFVIAFADHKALYATLPILLPGPSIQNSEASASVSRVDGVEVGIRPLALGLLGSHLTLQSLPLAQRGKSARLSER